MIVTRITTSAGTMYQVDLRSGLKRMTGDTVTGMSDSIRAPPSARGCVSRRSCAHSAMIATGSRARHWRNSRPARRQGAAPSRAPSVCARSRAEIGRDHERRLDISIVKPLRASATVDAAAVEAERRVAADGFDERAALGRPAFGRPPSKSMFFTSVVSAYPRMKICAEHREDHEPDRKLVGPDMARTPSRS